MRFKKLSNLLVFVLIALSGCATMRVEVEEMIKAGDDAKAARTGLLFLQSRDAIERPADEIAWLRRAVGEAALRIAIRQDTLEAYGGYRKELPDWPEVEDLKLRVQEREARLVFNDIHRTGDDEASHRRFRDTYPDSSFIYRSKQLEAGSAYARSRGARSIAALRAFRTQYCDWEEAKGVCEQAEIAEAHMALELAIESGNTREIARVKKRYRSIEGLALDAEAAEGQIAFAKAQKVGTAQAMEAFASAHPDHVLAQDATQIALEARLAQAQLEGTVAALKRYEERYGAKLPQKVQRMLREGMADVAYREWVEPNPKDRAALKRYVRAFKDLSGIHPGVTSAREGLAVSALEAARISNTKVAYEGVINEYKDWPPAVDIVRASKEGIATLDYVKARRLDTWEGWAAFVRQYDGWPEAAELVGQARKKAERLGKPLPPRSGAVAPAPRPSARESAPRAAAIVAPPAKPPTGPQVVMWREDSAKLGAIVQGLLPNVPQEGDSAAVLLDKKKKLARSLRALNRRWYGKRLRVKAARVTEKRPRLALTPNGKSSMKPKIKELKSSGWGRLVGRKGDVGLLATNLMGASLAGCDDCLRESGEIEIALEIPIPIGGGSYDAVESGILLDVTRLEAGDVPSVSGDTLAVHVTHVLPTERAAGRLNEGTIHPIKGHVQGIWMSPGELRIEIR